VVISPAREGSGAPDEFAVANLLHECAERLDLGDLEGMAALFTGASFRVDNGGQMTEYHGAGEVLAGFTGHVSLGVDGVPGTKHLLTNTRLSFDPVAGSAVASSYLTVLDGSQAPRLRITTCGRYEDTFTRDAGGWRFASRLFRVDHVLAAAGSEGE
jgi:hypothetical protein